jgi:hypothetical protein
MRLPLLVLGPYSPAAFTEGRAKSGNRYLRRNKCINCNERVYLLEKAFGNARITLSVVRV